MPPLVAATATVCAVELATLSAALRLELSVTIICLLLASFHSGYLVADPLRRRFSFGGRTLGSVTAVTAACLCLLGPTWSIPLAAIALFAFNSVAQALRRSLKDLSVVASITKNAGKAFGMTFGGVIGAFHLGPLAIIIFALYLSTRMAAGGPKTAGPAPVPRAFGVRDRLLLWGEFTHHAHYFAYCYSFWYLTPSLISPWIGVWFVLGWIAYFVTERIWREGRRVFAPKVIAGGHLLVAATLIAMPHLNSAGVALGWFVTGIGGGTAYMLGNAGQRGPRERFEDYGHVAGLLMAALIALLAVDNRAAAELTVTVGACLAVTTAIIFTLVSPRVLDQDTHRKGEISARR